MATLRKRIYKLSAQEKNKPLLVLSAIVKSGLFALVALGIVGVIIFCSVHQ
jgi:hypothetical protein